MLQKTQSLQCSPAEVAPRNFGHWCRPAPAVRGSGLARSCASPPGFRANFGSAVRPYNAPLLLWQVWGWMCHGEKLLPHLCFLLLSACGDGCPGTGEVSALIRKRSLKGVWSWRVPRADDCGRERECRDLKTYPKIYLRITQVQPRLLHAAGYPGAAGAVQYPNLCLEGITHCTWELFARKGIVAGTGFSYVVLGLHSLFSM